MSKRKPATQKLKLQTGELIAITRTTHNLEHYEKKYEHKYFGKSRIYHLKFETEDGKEVYAQFYQERMNLKTVNLICTHRNNKGNERRQKKCDARITLKHTLPTQSYKTEKDKKKYKICDTTKSWKISIV